jgi:D-erythro-7,8-dihydroneopterin triphosphate epimerase
VSDTVDYKKIKKNVMEHVENTRFKLIERLAHEVAGICLSDNKVQVVDVKVDKLGALRYADSVCVEVTRTR